MAASRAKGGSWACRRSSISLSIERLAVAGDDRLHHRVLGRRGLDERTARAAHAAGPPGHLRQELKGALGGAEVAMRQGDIGIDHADEPQQREIVALRHQLGADHDVGFAARDGLELLAQALDPAENVARQHRHARIREALGDLLGEPLDAGAAGDEAVLGGALRTGFRPRLGVAAMMADELAAEAVLDEPGRAIRAVEAVTAGPAQGQRRVAAAVEEQQRLTADPPASPPPPSPAAARSSARARAARREGRRP